MIQNTAKFTTQELLAIFNKDDVLFNQDINTEKVFIDSREVQPNSIFVAIKGENLDAHSKIPEAIQKGASICIVEKSWYEQNKKNLPNLNFIAVQNTIKALGKLANFHRYRYDIEILAIAGSNGKTTTKEMVAEVLSKKYKVLKTYKNFNNQIGVPLMLLSLNENIEIAVLEIGTNYPSEIFLLSEIVVPTAGIITNIGKEHLEGFIDLDGVESEETTLFSFLKKTDSKAFVNMDDERLKLYAMVLDNKFTYGLSTDNTYNLNVNITFDNAFNTTLICNNQETEFQIKLKAQGLNFAYNAIPAIAAGLHYKLPIDLIKNALENFIPDLSNEYARMAIENKNNITLLNDTYNANPSSTTLALETLKHLTNVEKKIAILGDMLELGESSLTEHISMINIAIKDVDALLLVGNEYSKAKQEIDAPNLFHFESKSNLIDFLYDLLKKDKEKSFAILVKGSRGMKMEEIIIAIKNNFFI
jgi:UDP-N-acetylmuramoyl-tripeptide--D-alanyl-D-alanine ligase